MPQEIKAGTTTAGLIGYTEHCTDLPGGRAANVFTMRACVVRADGTGRRELASGLVAGDTSIQGARAQDSAILNPEPRTLNPLLANSWTQFAGWSPDGRQAIVACGWESSENAAWEEEHKTFRMIPGAWPLDTWLVDLATGKPFDFCPAWSPDRRWVYYTAKVSEAVELMRVSLAGKVEQLSHSPPGILHYHPKVSADRRQVVFGATRDGVRQLYVANADGSEARPITTLTKGHAAMHAHWQPVHNGGD